ncbi:MAG: ATP synthase F1 subunit delta [Flavobacteriaceae bacterium]|jgi:F-type H+-transporting ATPase subunit delta|nr:ATP synthase F1 subunit delta [Flavobacteriaceae bacterium]
MKDARAALRYAKAILNLAKETKSETSLQEDMLLVLDTISNNKELKVVLESPIIKPADKLNVLNATFSKNVNNITLGLFNLLKENGRIDILASVAKQYVIIYDHYKQISVAKVITAEPLTKEIEKQVLDKIVELTGDKADLENIVNPNILGGFILRVGDVQYDASISNYLNELRKEFDNGHYIPKI